MLSFVFHYIWAAIVVPVGCILMKPFTGQQYADNISHYICFDLLKIKHNYTRDAELIEQGFILANHRCALDFYIDPYLSKSAIVARGMAHMANMGYGLLSLMEGRGIILYRGTDTRQTTYAKCKTHFSTNGRRVLFYPEGTRLSYTSLSSADELKGHLKFGLLKSIYEDGQNPVQIQISNNKELALNEKKLSFAFNVEINTRLSKPIHPADFATDEEFFNEIARVWYDCYVSTHEKKNE
jgi:1-acyl-sn-glycerol-3-phosphate acyltransferase